MQATQSLALHTLTALHLLRTDWGGKLILSAHFGAPGASLAIAANIAGAACLTIEPDNETLKLAMREGACDFVVTTLDEALRTLKNEIRKKLPLSVGLLGSPEGLLPEIAERGILPDLFNTPDPHSPAIAILEALGASLVNFSEASSPSLQQANDFAKSNGWTLTTHQAATSRELAVFDADLMASLQAGEQLRRQWLAAAPRFFRRETPPTRTYWRGL